MDLLSHVPEEAMVDSCDIAAGDADSVTVTIETFQAWDVSSVEVRARKQEGS